MLLHIQRTWTEMELLHLVCFCLLTCSGTTFGDEEPPVTKIRVKEDEDVILPCSLDSANIQYDTFDWKKDDQKEVFMYSEGSHYNNGRSGQDPQFKGRVFHFEDQLQSGVASIVIRNTKVTDSGRYTCIFPLPQKRTGSMIELIVGSSPMPYVTNLHETHDQALLECKVHGVFPKPEVQWLDSDNNTVAAEEPHITESGGKFNIILKATVKKSDVYRCVSKQEEICHRIYNEIHVNLNGPNTGLIVGVVLAVVIVPLLVFVFLYCKQKSKAKNYRAELKAVKSELDELKNNHQNGVLSSGSAQTTNS